MKYSIKELRARKNLTQEQAAENMGVSVPTWYRWEKDFGTATVKQGMEVAEMFGVKIDDIFYA